MNIKKHIPNFITILNLVCGVFAILFFVESLRVGDGVFSGCFGGPTIDERYIYYGITLILIATLLDFLDGFAARLLKVQSEIGAQLDSLADMVTFGVAPGFLFYALIQLIMKYSEFDSLENIKYLFLFIPIFSALRLAKFNIDTEQTDYFKGLATPANAIFWVGMVFFPFFQFMGEIISILFLGILAIILSLLMVSNLRMFSLKLKNLKLEGDNIYRVLLIAGAVILTIIFGLFTNILAAVPFIILLYILLSVSYHYSTRNTKNKKETT